MLKFKRTTLPTNPKNSICIEVEGKDTWYECSAEVKSYAQQNLKASEQCEITKENRDGKEFVTKISRPGQAGSPAAASPAASAPAASAAPAAQKTQEPVKSSYGTKSPEDSKQIRRLSVLSSACNAVAAIQSQLEPNTLPDYVVALYTKLLAEVEK